SSTSTLFSSLYSLSFTCSFTSFLLFFFNHTATSVIYTLSLHDALPISGEVSGAGAGFTLIQTFGDIGNSTFICNPATATGAEGGWAEFDFGTASGAKFVANGAASAGPQAGQVYVYGADGDATFTANGGRGS